MKNILFSRFNKVLPEPSSGYYRVAIPRLWELGLLQMKMRFEVEVPDIAYKMFKITPAKCPDHVSLQEIITPTGSDWMTLEKSIQDSDTPLPGNTSIDLNGSYTEVRRLLGRFHSFDVKRSLFSSKRLAEETTDSHPESSAAKRLRATESALNDFSIENPIYCDKEVKTALNLLSTNTDLIADSSRPYALSTITGKHQDLKSITANTLREVMSGCYDDMVDNVTVIDCRYPYEFEGGHIQGALNLYTRDTIQAFLNKNSCLPIHKKHILIFHCEFSSERGPRMYRFLRSQDRAMNKSNYPQLNFPEIYLLDSGYKAFFHSHKEMCEPPTYTPMLDKDFASDLRRFRAKSKSWTAGEKIRPSSRLTLRF